MSLVKSVKNTKFYTKLKKLKDDYKTRRMISHNKKKNYQRKLELYEKSKGYQYNIFDYKSIIEERPDNDYEYTAYNGFYGLSYIMKRYTGYKGLIYPIFLHNSNIDLWSYAEFEMSCNSIGIVCSDRLGEKVENNTDKVTISIGPSIMYAKGVLKECEVRKIKKDLGKTLLILPGHSIEEYNCDSNVEAFLEYTQRVKEKYNFDTVLVCLYFNDILNGVDKYYVNKGYKVVSAGHRNSKDFLDVQRSLYEICDGVISQSYTSGLSYGYCLGKPISIFATDLIYSRVGMPNEKLIPTNSAENDKFIELFGDYTDTLTDEQREYAEFLWNVSKKRNPEELLFIFDLAKKIDKCRSKTKKITLINEIKEYK